MEWRKATIIIRRKGKEDVSGVEGIHYERMAMDLARILKCGAGQACSLATAGLREKLVSVVSVCKAVLRSSLTPYYRKSLDCRRNKGKLLVVHGEGGEEGREVFDGEENYM